MTPVGHFSVGVLIAEAAGDRWSKRILGAALAGSLAPDLDFLLFALPGFNELHRGASHSIFAGIVGGALLARWLPFRIFFAAFLLHLGVDTLLDANPTNGVGVAWFWPVDPRVLGFGWVLPMQPTPSWNEPLGARHLLAIAWNVGMYEIPFAVLAGWMTWKRHRTKTCHV